MPAGLECYTPGGMLTFTTEDRLARFLGSVYVGAIQDGAAAAPGLSSAGGTPFYYFVSDGQSIFGIGCPNISSSGDTLYWSYANTMAQHRSTGTIFYGYM